MGGKLQWQSGYWPTKLPLTNLVCARVFHETADSDSRICKEKYSILSLFTLTIET